MPGGGAPSAAHAMDLVLGSFLCFKTESTLCANERRDEWGLNICAPSIAGI